MHVRHRYQEASVTSTTATLLDTWFNVIFGDWFSRDLVTFMFMGVAALLVLLGVAFFIARPAGIGVAVVSCGLITIINSWIWYVLPSMKSKHGTAIAFIAMLMLAVCWILKRAATNPTSAHYGLTKPFLVILWGFNLHILFFASITLTLFLPSWTPLVMFATASLAVLGTAVCAIGVAWAAVNRVRAIPKRRPFDTP
jgi:hypothetical protein